MSSEDKGMMHKSKTAKDSEVVGEKNGVMHSAFFQQQSRTKLQVSKANQGEKLKKKKKGYSHRGSS